MWPEVIRFVAATGISVAAITAATAWLVRQLVAQAMSRDIERFKAGLQRELETAKAQLQKEALEHEVRFRRVDEKVADAISKVYSRLHQLLETVNSYVKELEASDEPNKNEKLEQARIAKKAFNKVIFGSRIYLPASLYDRARDLGGRLGAIADRFTRGRRHEEAGMRPPGQDHYEEAFEAINNDANSLFSDLVAEFQKRIGVVDE